jgi:transcriptional regulator with XRE-family HTH domain
MGCSKTGAFIAAMRKQRGWTQGEFAEKIGVTDKAVSRWETGHGYPDVSLLKPLSEALSVSAGELLAGEVIEPEHMREKSDEMLIDAITSSKKRVRKTIAICLYVFGGAFFLWAFAFLGYDTSWVSVYATLGLLFAAVAAFLTFSKRLIYSFAAALVVLLLGFGFFEARDYVSVTRNAMPPLFSFRITTTFYNDKVIKYDKLFYDVYRYHADSADECYVIVPNRVSD